MVRIVNLGSSFAAGPGIQPIIDKAAMRSGANYAHLLADRLGADLIDLSVSGATLLNITDTAQTANGHTFAPQIQGVPENTDIVLVLGGGNDMGYVGGLFKEHTWLMAGMSLTSRLKGVAMPEPPAPADGEEVTTRYGKVLDAIHTTAPNARVIVVEYLTLLGPDTRPGVDVPCNAERLRYHQKIASNLQKATAAVVESRSDWCELVSMADLSQAHGIGSAEPWVFGCTSLELLTGKTWYHPNAEGMKAVAKALHEQITSK